MSNDMNDTSTHFTQDEFILPTTTSGRSTRGAGISTSAANAARAGAPDARPRSVTPAEVVEPMRITSPRVGSPLVAPASRAEESQADWTKWCRRGHAGRRLHRRLLWNRSNTGPVHTRRTNPLESDRPATAASRSSSATASCWSCRRSPRHSERMLVELTNLSASDNIDVDHVTYQRNSSAPKTAVQQPPLPKHRARPRRGRVATLLDELEPMLMQIAHGPSQLTPDELHKVQKRVEAKGLVFKLRVLRADVRATSAPQQSLQPNI